MRNGPIYALLFAAVLFLGGEAHLHLREWWKDRQLRREINRRGAYLRPGWSSAGSERFRGRLAKVRWGR